MIEDDEIIPFIEEDNRISHSSAKTNTDFVEEPDQLLLNESRTHSEEGSLDIQGTAHTGEILTDDVSYLVAIWHVGKIGVPFGISQALLTGADYMGSIFLSRLSKAELAANSIIGIADTTVTCLSTVLLATPIVVARRTHVCPPDVGQVYQNVMALSAALSVPIGVLIFFGGKVARSMGYPEELSEISGNFLKIYALAVPALLMLNASQKIALATSHAYILPAASFIKFACKAGLGYLFVFGIGPFPNLGVRGLALSATIGNYLSLFGMSLFLYCKKSFLPYHLFKFQLGLDSIRIIQKELWTLGIPMTISSVADYLSYFGMTLLTSHLGNDSLDAQQIALQWSGFSALPMMSYLQGLSVLNSQALSCKKFTLIKKYTLASTLIVFNYSALVLALALITPMTFINPFLDSTQEGSSYTKVISVSKKLLMSVGLGSVPLGLGLTYTSALYGFNDVQTATMNDLLLGFAFTLGIGYLLGFTAGLGMLGFFVARNIGEIVVGIIMIARFLYVYRGAANGNQPKDLLGTVKDNVQHCFCAKANESPADSENNAAHPSTWSTWIYNLFVSKKDLQNKPAPSPDYSGSSQYLISEDAEAPHEENHSLIDNPVSPPKPQRSSGSSLIIDSKPKDVSPIVVNEERKDYKNGGI